MSRQLIEETLEYGIAMSFACFMSMQQLGEHSREHDTRLRLEWWHRMLACAALSALKEAP